MTAHEPTGRSASGRAGAAIAVVFWTACWLLPWPALLGRDPFLCSTLGLVLFCLPGFCADLLLRRDARLTVARRAPVALVLSAALTGALGFIGSLLHLPTASVGLALWAAGAVGLARVVRRGTPPSSGEPYDGQRIFAGVLLLAIALATARLCLSPVMGADDMTYVARVTWFQQTPYLSFRGMIFGGDVQISPRDWLAFWPLCEAIVANLSGVHGLQLTTLYLGPLLAPLAVLAVYGLARALGMSRRAAVTSCALQVVALLLLVGRDQPGGPFFQRLVEDKFLALFVFGPALLQLVIGVLDGDGARARVALALGWLGIVLVHPTALGIVFLIVCAFCALELVATRRRTPLLVLAIVIPITAAASSVRFLPSETHHAAYFGIEEAARANAISGARKRRVDVVAGTRFYGIGRRSAPPVARAAGALVLAVALLHARRLRSARYVAAATSVAACAVFPYSGWLLGGLLTPFHLWRILAAVPYGIGLTFALGAAAAELERRGIWSARRLRRAATAGPVLATALLFSVAAWAAAHPRTFRIAALRVPRDWTERLDARVKFDRSRPRLAFADLLLIGAALNDAIEDRATVVGDPEVNSLIPSLSAKAVLIAFRSPVQTAQFSGMPNDRARSEWRTYQRLTLGQLPADAALDAVRTRDVRFVVTATEHSWLAAIDPNVLPRREIASAGPLTLYELSPAATPH